MFTSIILLALAGVVLLIAEIFLLGMVAGFLGVLAFLAATYLSFVAYGIEVGLIALCVFTILGISIFFGWLYTFPGSAFARKLTLNTAVKSPQDHPNHTALVGMEGVALTSLRPAGTALINNKRIDVLAESGFIDTQDRVKVILAEGAKVVVRKQSTS